MPGSKFRQQNLAAWQPILKGSSALPVFFFISATFIPVGILLLIISNKVKEFIYDYTYCIAVGPYNGTCADFIKNPNNIGKKCYCNFTVQLEEFRSPVFIYYGLSNMYQNHRRFVRSRDDDQLYGYSILPESLKRECDPYKTLPANGSIYGFAPCGAIANSLFNDTFTITYESIYPLKLIRTGIALIADKTNKFNNPKSWASFKKPQNWNTPVWMLDPDDPENNGYKNEDLLVWMRTAPMPTFRKLYRRVNHSVIPFLKGLPAGNYSILILYNYPVAIFNGKKNVIISTTSILGGKNPFLGIAYIAVGFINSVVGLSFLIIGYLRKGRKRSSDTAKVRIIKVY